MRQGKQPLFNVKEFLAYCAAILGITLYSIVSILVWLVLVGVWLVDSTIKLLLRLRVSFNLSQRRKACSRQTPIHMVDISADQ